MEITLPLLTIIIESCQTKEALLTLLNVRHNKKMSNEMLLMLALHAIDKLFKKPDTDQTITFNVRFNGEAQHNNYVIDNIWHLHRNDLFYLSCLNKIIQLHHDDLIHDRKEHPAFFSLKTNKQHYDNRNEQIYYINELTQILSKLSQVLYHEKSCDVNPNSTFVELCHSNPDTHRFTNDILHEVCSRVRDIFHKKVNGEFSIMEIWNINHTKRMSTDIKLVK